MTATLTTPWGTLRTATQRRYVLVGYRHSWQRAIVIHRSDNRHALRTSPRRRAGDIIIDTVTNQEV